MLCCSEVVMIMKWLVVILITIPMHSFSKESIMVPVLIDDETINLEMHIFKPSGNGPFPTLILNHGSTGTGKEPEQFRQIWEFGSLRRFFLTKDYAVIRIFRRGRGQSEGIYDEGFSANRAEGYSCDPNLSIPGADRGIQDIKAAMEVIQKMPYVDAENMFMGGWSRGGILSVIYAGKFPNQVKGVINFVGGWVNAHLCATAAEIHEELFQRGASYPKVTLWLYGNYDPYYSLSHSRSNFEAFKRAGGKGEFYEFQALPASSGHEIIFFDGIWDSVLEKYLNQSMENIN